jgi:hypothetical protein
MFAGFVAGALLNGTTRYCPTRLSTIMGDFVTLGNSFIYSLICFGSARGICATRLRRRTN